MSGVERTAGAPLCEAWAVEPGTVRRVDRQGRSYAVFNVDGAYYVTDDTCTHGFASLSEGMLDGHVVTCPWHGGEFDVRDGRALSPPCTDPLRVHPCRLEDGVLRIDSLDP
jgi:nitrite reductase/ring-hydroxylating ferredoxin subunit